MTPSYALKGPVCPQRPRGSAGDCHLLDSAPPLMLLTAGASPLLAVLMVSTSVTVTYCFFFNFSFWQFYCLFRFLSTL